MGRTGGELLTAQLRAEGVEVVFGLPGIQLMRFLDALHGEPAIRFVTTRHEQATTFMADGYARVSGRPGTALVVPGPGVYNAGAGLATAYACSSPVLLLAGQIEQHGLGRGLSLTHEIDDQLDVVRPVTKWAHRVLSADDIPAAVRRAFATMLEGRTRPVELEMPPEVFAADTDSEVIPPEPVPVHEPDPELVATAADLLAAADEPLIVAGGGAVLAGATAELTGVAEALQAAVVNTREGKGAIDERHPLFVGTAWVNRRLRPVLAAADVILAVGTRYQGVGLAEGQRLIHADVDPAEIGKHAEPTLAVTGDARVFLARLREELDRRLPAGGRPDRTAERRAAKRAIDDDLAGVGPQAEMVRALRRAVPEDGVLVAGTTTVGYMCHLAYPVYGPRTYITSSYMGTLGYCYPTALGAKLARPDLPVVSINGDGGFLFTSAELATAMQSGINVVAVVFNDSAYGNTHRDQMDNFGGRVIGTELHNPDFAAYAESFGAVGVRVPTVDQLEGAIREGLADDRPVVIELPMDRLPSIF
ncbi:MAG TPA: thiamine pyrophosphate-dependent enzyme [Acidimicrobiales bacterium]